jgi:hypothetical protein
MGFEGKASKLEDRNNLRPDIFSTNDMICKLSEAESVRQQKLSLDLIRT